MPGSAPEAGSKDGTLTRMGLGFSSSLVSAGAILSLSTVSFARVGVSITTGEPLFTNLTTFDNSCIRPAVPRLSFHAPLPIALVAARPQKNLFATFVTSTLSRQAAYRYSLFAIREYRIKRWY